MVAYLHWWSMVYPHLTKYYQIIDNFGLLLSFGTNRILSMIFMVYTFMLDTCSDCTSLTGLNKKKTYFLLNILRGIVIIEPMLPLQLAMYTHLIP